MSQFAYASLLAFFCAKYLILIALQGVRRRRAKLFRWPEDAAAFGGVAHEREDPLVERAQRALDHESESQALVLALAGAWVAFGADGAFASAAFAVYAGTRAIHTWWLLFPRQPARTRVFGIGVVVMIIIAIDTLRLASLVLAR